MLHLTSNLGHKFIRKPRVPGIAATGSGWNCNCWSHCVTDWLFLSFSKPYEWMSDFPIVTSLQESLAFLQTPQALHLRGTCSPNAEVTRSKHMYFFHTILVFSFQIRGSLPLWIDCRLPLHPLFSLMPHYVATLTTTLSSYAVPTAINSQLIATNE